MGGLPQPSQPPLPAAPTRSRSNVLAIVLLVLGLIVLLSGIAVWGGLRFLTHRMRIQVSDATGRKGVSIKTPFGGIEVIGGAAVTEANLGLPIYPSAHPLKDDNAATVSLGTVSLRLPGENNLRIVVGKFETSDSFTKVRDFYRDRLTALEGPFRESGHIGSDQEGNFFGLDSDGKTVFKIKREGDERVVALQDEAGSTRIELVRVGKTGGQAN